MKHLILLSLTFFVFIITVSATGKKSDKVLMGNTDTMIVKTAVIDNSISGEWKDAIKSRMTRESIDSFGRLRRALSPDEMDWKKLIESKAATWNGFRDSLAVAFGETDLNDTIFVMLGYLGVDDGFTYGSQTVCLDVTALFRAYGKAGLAENNDRIDRIFAHEYSHLLHKSWAKKNKLLLPTFKDSILWECLYEGIGMYRSLNPKWIPVQGIVPGLTKTALENLYPIFVDRLTTIERTAELTAEEKEQLNKNLSRGQVNQKWGAFPVAIWLALEADGDDKKLQGWISKGPAAVIQLAKKYLPGIHHQRFVSVFK